MLLQELKKGKNLIAIILLIFLFIIPLYNDIYHRGLYYIIVGFILAPLTFYRIMRNNILEKRFYQKWSEKRTKGRLANIFIESMKTIISIVAIVFAGLFIVNGHTPTDILSGVPINIGIGLIVFILAWGILIGIITWYENEKKYYRYHYKIEDKI